MTIADVKAEALAVWDVSNLHEWQPWMAEANAWAQRHIAHANFTYRVEFYLLDAPFAVICRYVKNEAGGLYLDPATGDAVCAAPVTEVLDELPPAHLLERRVR